MTLIDIRSLFTLNISITHGTYWLHCQNVAREGCYWRMSYT